MSKSKNASTAAAQNPNDASARGLYAPVVAKEGTIDGKPARVALYGTRYAACEVESGGEWTVHQDVGFGGIRGIGQLKQYLDDITVEPAPVVEVVAEVVAPAVEVVPAAVEPEPVVETAPAAVEPVLNTLDEVRAAFDAETRGACRASVLRALRVRAGEIALGLPAGGKAEKVKAERDRAEGEGKRTARMGLVEMLARGIVKVGDEVRLRTKEGAFTTLSEGGNAADGKSLSQWATEQTGFSHNIYRSFLHVPTGKTLDELRG